MEKKYLYSFSSLFKIIREEVSEQNIPDLINSNFDYFRAVLSEKTNSEKFHSNFIYYLLNPAETHNCKDFFLKYFLQIPQIQNVLKVSDNLTNVSVKKERYIPQNERRIDISVEYNNEWIIFIENKINAKEQTNQLQDYYNFSKNFKQQAGIFLTVDGRFPESIRDSDKEHIVSLSYKDIIVWLNNISENIPQKSNLHFIINQYVNSVDKLYQQQTTKKYMNDSIAFLQNNLDKSKIFFKYRNDFNEIINDYSLIIRKRFAEEVKSELFKMLSRSNDFIFEYSGSSNEIRVIFTRDDSEYYIQIEGKDDEDNNKGFWWGVYKNEENFECGLNKGFWQELFYNAINLYENPDKAAYLITEAADKKTYTEFVEKIASVIHTDIKNYVFEKIKENYFLKHTKPREHFFKDVRKELAKQFQKLNLKDIKYDFRKIYFRKDDISFILRIEPINKTKEDNGYGSWFGIFDSKGNEINCGLENGFWEGVKIGNYNDFYDFTKVSEMIYSGKITEELKDKTVNFIFKKFKEQILKFL